jgi:hypothetical protein
VRLRVDNGLHDLIRNRIKNGEFSRNAYDITICLYFFGNNYQLHKNNADKVLFSKLLKDLKFMQIADLRSLHLDYLVKAMQIGS